MIMFLSTEEIVKSVVSGISAMSQVQSIGISGGKLSLPKVGEGDIDIFIYCDAIPFAEERQAILKAMGEMVQDVKINVFEGGHWGTGDFLSINGVETWLMYFTVKQNTTDVEGILNGEHPDKVDNYYYPVGRLAMLKEIAILHDKNGYLDSVKKMLSEYPQNLAEKLIQYHLDELDDIEDLERAIARKDVLFYHFAMDLAMDHFLQVIFAKNNTYFPSRKRSLEYIKIFNMKPRDCEKKLLEVVKLGACPESMEQSYAIWRSLTDELRYICNIQA